LKACLVTASGERETQSETQTGAVAHEEKRKPSLVFMPAPKSTSQKTTLGGKVFCEIYKTASQTDKTIAQNNVFVQGCSSFHVESVKIHESSTNHRDVGATTINELNQRRLQSEMQI